MLKGNYKTYDLTKQKQHQPYAKTDIPLLPFDFKSLVFFCIFLYLAGDKEIRRNCCEDAISMFNHMGSYLYFALFLKLCHPPPTVFRVFA